MRYARFLTAITLAGLLAFLQATSAHAQDEDGWVFDFDTEGATICGQNENNSPMPENDPPDVIAPLRDMRRGIALTCEDTVDDAFGSSEFSTSYEKERSVFFPIINDAAGIVLGPRSSVSFLAWHLTGGPAEGRLSYNVGSDTTLRELGTFPLTEMPTQHSILLHPIMERFGVVMDSVNIFFQPRFADAATVDSSGTFYLDDIAVAGEIFIPVELTSFTAALNADRAVLRWQTASETNNYGFAVERKKGGTEEWTRLGFVEGAGTTTEAQRYRFRTGALTPGTYTFRLRQIDVNGDEELHGPVTVEVGLDERFMLRAPYPNPARGQATVAFASRASERVQVTLFDALGRRVKTLYAGTLPAGQLKRVRVSAGGLASGLYVVRLRGEGGAVRTQALTLVR